MADFKISVDMSGIVSALDSLIHEQVFPRVGQAIEALAVAARADWQQAIYHAKLWDGEKKPYMESIQVKMTGPYSALVWSEYKYAHEIETGRPARDLKKMLDTSPKVRISKQGKRYLIIPFRHNTPGNTALAAPMPQNVYDIVSSREFKGSAVIGQYMRTSGLGAMDPKSRKLLTVKQAQYAWGSRLQNGLTKRLSPKHSNAPTDGMVRMQTTPPGGPKSSAYLTFRVMVEGSNKWIIPAKPGLNLVKGVADRLQPLAEKAIQEAVKRDLT